MSCARRRRRHATRHVVAGVVVVVGLALALAAGAVAAFTAKNSNQNNVFVAGSVAIGDNDAGSALFSLSGLKPGDTSTACIRVTYTGSLPTTVRLYGSTTGTGLDQYTSLQITRGTYTGVAPTFPSCTNFAADATTYIGGQSAGVIYAGTLSGVGTSWATGQGDPSSGSPATWTTDTAVVYKIQVALGDNAAAAGKNATETFTWEARNT